MVSEAPTIGKTFGARLGELRSARGWSQRQLVEELERAGFTKLDRTAIARIETNGRKVSVDEAVALAVALGVSPFALLLPTSGNVRLTDTRVEPVEVVSAWLRNSWQLPEPPDPDADPEEVQRRRIDTAMLFWQAVPASELAFMNEYPELHLVGLNLRTATVQAQQGHATEVLRQLDNVQLALNAAIEAAKAAVTEEENDR